MKKMKPVDYILVIIMFIIACGIALSAIYQFTLHAVGLGLFQLFGVLSWLVLIYIYVKRGKF